MKPGQAYFDRMPEKMPEKPSRKRITRNAFGEINPDNPPKDCVRQKEAARRYGLSTLTIRRLVDAGKITCEYDSQNTRWVVLNRHTREVLRRMKNENS